MSEHLDEDLQMERDGHVFRLILRRPPNNFLDADVIGRLAALLETADSDQSCRAVVLASQGKHFCAGADLAKRLSTGSSRNHIYGEAARLARTRKPIVAAVQGAAIGAGLGLALLADFRLGCERSRFSANFSRQGYYPGFGLTYTLPRLVGEQHASWMLFSGERVTGERALEMGLVDQLVAEEELMHNAMAMAREIAASGPLAVLAIRRGLRADFESRFSQSIESEMLEQDKLTATEDYREGVQAMAERRPPVFRGM